MKKDTISDIGGFMIPRSPPVRRTSRFKISYMVPVMTQEDVLGYNDTQFHTRSVHTVEKDKQSIYNIEIASALYTVTFQLDEDLVAVPSTPYDGKVEGEDELEKQKPARVEASIKALYYLLTGNFGGKRSRILPHMKLMSLVVTQTDFQFIPNPGHDDNYIESTIRRLEKAKKILDGKVAKTYIINNENLNIPSSSIPIVTLTSPEELIEVLIDGKK